MDKGKIKALVVTGNIIGVVAILSIILLHNYKTQQTALPSDIDEKDMTEETEVMNPDEKKLEFILNKTDEEVPEKTKEDIKITEKENDTAEVEKEEESQEDSLNTNNEVNTIETEVEEEEPTPYWESEETLENYESEEKSTDKADDLNASDEDNEEKGKAPEEEKAVDNAEEKTEEETTTEVEEKAEPEPEETKELNCEEKGMVDNGEGKCIEKHPFLNQVDESLGTPYIVTGNDSYVSISFGEVYIASIQGGVISFQSTATEQQKKHLTNVLSPLASPSN